MVFFGPPHRGLNHPQLQDCVFATPPENLVSDMKPKSTLLRSLNESFAKVCKDLPIVTCFEMNETKSVIRTKDGSWPQEGPLEMMVDSSAACLYIANEMRIPVHADHSLCAKLNDDPGCSYHQIKDAISSMVEDVTGIPYHVSRLFHLCMELNKVFISALEAGNQLSLASKFAIEMTRL